MRKTFKPMIAAAVVGVAAVTRVSVGQVLVKDINPGLGESYASSFVTLNSQAYFTADDGTHGIELWKTDGTTAGTQLVIDLSAGAANGFPSNLTAVNGALYFGGYNTSPAAGTQVYRSDGTAAGTTLLADTDPTQQIDFFAQPPGNFTSLNNSTTLFTSLTTGIGIELWKTDGTPGGTKLVKDVHPGAFDSIPIALTTLNGVTYFAADDSAVHNDDDTYTFDREIFRTDGTEAGTYRVKDINPGPKPSTPTDLHAFGNAVYFRADDGVNGTEFWKTDGTSSGTTLVADINPGANGSNLQDIRTVGNMMMFQASDAAHGAELWASDGTAAGTHLVKDINPAGDSLPLSSVIVRNRLYFNADDGSHGNELWESDGSEAGTKLVFDSVAGDAGGSPNELTVIGNDLFYTTVINNPDYSVKTILWMTDTTTDLTTMIFEEPGLSFGYSINNLTALGNTLLFMAPQDVDADGFSINTELMAYSVPEPASALLLVLAGGALSTRRRHRA